MQMAGVQHPDLPATEKSWKRRRSSDRGCKEKEEVKKKKVVEDKAGPSAATSEKGRFNFCVFISFRGKDTRNGFTSHLHKEFESRGIRTFIDSKDLEKGKRIDELFDRMEESKIFVTVLSKAYAQSKWCLKEITKMVEINKREGEKRPIVPIFYHVSPSDVKHFRASFGKAFKKHRRDKKLGEEQIDEWEAALAEVGSISGYCLSQTEGNEAKLITLIAAQISKILNRVPFDIQPIGIKSHIIVLKQMLERENEGNCMIGICGPGGIGKTTIAMALYNELSPTFEGCCFLEDIREHEKREAGLPLLQAKLMEEVLRGKIEMRNVGQGVSLMKQRLGIRRILLILDDVDHTRQLEAFIAHRGRNEAWFGAGSMIIVTTRNKEVLLRHGLKEDEIYSPQVLDPDQSLQLFFHHAFVSDQLLAQLGNLPQEIVEVAAGLPLALVVFGSHFSLLKKKNEWENDLKRLKTEQNQRVYEKLRISYESLNHREKLVFLDIACFFIGKTKECPIYMWEACGCFPENTLKVLQHKSLIKINKDDEFEMHDQIRDMGRMVVEEEGNFDPLKYSRAWSKDQALKVYEDAEASQGNPHLQCICLFGFPKLSREVVAAMPELRLMTGVGGHPGDRNEQGIHLPRKLKWLSWEFYDYPTLTFHSNRHQQLRILNLSSGLFSSFGMHSMVFPQLKVLDLHHCFYLILTPDFTYLPSLEQLRLDSCRSLIEVDESIGHLRKLLTLRMSECTKLKGLPTGLCKLTSLEFFDISMCEQISSLPDEIGNMKSLKHLDLGWTSISDLPYSIARLQSLESLLLAGCSSLRSIPIFMQRPVQSPSGASPIGRVQRIQPGFMEGVRQSPGVCYASLILQARIQPGFMEGAMRYASRIQNVLRSQLRRLYASRIQNVLRSQLRPLYDRLLRGLYDTFQTDQQGFISRVNLLNPIGKLRVVCLDGCRSLRSIDSFLVDNKNICTLSLRDCVCLQELPQSIGRLLSLQELDLSGCTSLRKIPNSIGNLKNLKRFSLQRCRSLKELPESMGSLKSLKALHISGGKSVKKVPNFIGKLKNLRELHVREVEEISELISSLSRLEKICIKDCSKLKSLPGQLPPSLTHLKVLRCSAFGKLPSVSDLNELKTLHLGGCKALTSLFNLVLFNSFKKSIFTCYDGLGSYLMDKFSKALFEPLKGVFLSGASVVSHLLFGLPKCGQVVELLGLFSLIQELSSVNGSSIDVCIQVDVQGKIVTEGRWRAHMIKEDVHRLEKLGMEGMALYGIAIKEAEEIFRYVKEGEATLRVPTTYNGYQLKAAYLAMI